MSIFRHTGDEGMTYKQIIEKIDQGYTVDYRANIPDPQPHVDSWMLHLKSYYHRNDIYITCLPGEEYWTRWHTQELKDNEGYATFLPHIDSFL